MEQISQAVLLLREFCTDVAAAYGPTGPIDHDEWFDLAKTYASALTLLHEIDSSPATVVDATRVYQILNDFRRDVRAAYGLDEDDPENRQYGVDGVDVDEMDWPDLFATYQKVNAYLGNQ